MDALDQSEVDALLEAVESGAIAEGSSPDRVSPPDLESEGVTRPEPGDPNPVRDYDFKRPERVSKDQMRSLESLHESFARNFGASLSTFLRTIVECRVATIEQLTYSEFIHALPNPTCFNLIEAPPLEGEMCLEISPLIVYPILDRLLGGSNAEMFIPQRPMTSIEFRLVRRITDRALSCLNESWGDLATVKFELEDTESNPQLVQIVAPNEIVVVIGFELKMGARAGTMSLCIPFNVIEPVISKLGSQSWSAYSRKAQRQDQSGAIATSLKHAGLQLICYLAETQMTVNDLLNLQVGDIVRTDKSCTEELVLRIEGRNKFAGRIGQFRGLRAFQITRRTLPDEQL